MNQQGILWKKTIEKDFPKGYKEPGWSSSKLQERMMRIGLEYRLYTNGHTSDIETIARLTLKDDYKKEYYKSKNGTQA